MSKLFPPTTKGRITAIVVFLLFSMVAGGIMGFLQASGRLNLMSSTMVVAVFVPVAIILVGFSFWVGAWWMKSIDEAAQEAHKWSWYWGGSCGLSIAMFGYLAFFLPASADWDLPTMSGRTDPMAYAVTGGLFVIFLLLAGYTIAWALWWFQRR